MEINYQGFYIFLLVLSVIAVIYLIGVGFASSKKVKGCPVLKTCGPDEKVYLYNPPSTETCSAGDNDPICSPSSFVTNSLPYSDTLDLTPSFPVSSGDPLPDWSTTTITNIEVYSHFPTLGGPTTFPTCDLGTKDSIPYGTHVPGILVANFDLCGTPTESPPGTFSWGGCSGTNPNGEDYTAVWTNNGDGTLDFDLTGSETFFPGFLYWRITYEVTDAEGCIRNGIGYYDFRFGL